MAVLGVWADSLSVLSLQCTKAGLESARRVQGRAGRRLCVHEDAAGCVGLGHMGAGTRRVVGSQGTEGRGNEGMSGPLRVCVGQKGKESLAGGRVQVTRGAGLGPEFHDRPPGATTYPGAHLGTCGAAGTTRDETLEALSGTVGRLCARSSHTTSHSVPSAVTMHTACVAASVPQEPKSPVKAACAPAPPRAVCELAVMQSAKTIRPHTGHTTGEKAAVPFTLKVF